jgi:cytochrome c biogenesis protein CcdA/glutaredoxin
MTRILLVVLMLLPSVGYAAEAPMVRGEHQTDVVLFYGQGCSHCAAIRQFLQTLREDHPGLRLHEYEVYFDHDNARTFAKLASAYGVEVRGVPTLFVGDRVIVGFSEASQTETSEAIVRCLERGPCPSPLDRLAPSHHVGSLTLGAVVVGALVDAINPCAFAVLVILVTTVLGAGGRRRALEAGLAFSLAVFVAYYLMGVGLFTAVAATGIGQALYVAVMILAFVIGLLNLKDYFWYGKFFVTEVPLAWRPTLKKLIRKVTSVPGAFLIGLVVSTFLLPCTSGPYIVILGLLAKTATRTSALLWLLLYNVIFIAPMIAITAAVCTGFTTPEKAEAWRTNHLRQLHLVAGALLLLLAIGMFVSLMVGR